MYQVKNFDHLLGMPGFSDTLLQNHFTLYQGYVTNFNKLDQIIMDLEKESKFSTPQYAELNRRLGWEWNGMRLHELYFENMAKQSSAPPRDSEFIQKIIKEWGSLELWQKDFTSMGVMRGIGWVILYRDHVADRLFNVWVNEHDLGHFAGAAPLLVMDVFEHAYLTDYGLKRADYVETFFRAIDWGIVSERFQKNS